MKSDAMSKLSASCIVLVMLLSTLVLVPGSSESDTASTKNIYVPVLSGGLPVTTGAWVNLTEVHSGAVTPAQYKSEYTAYVVSGASSGYYRLDVVANDYYDVLSADEFRFDGQNDLTTDVVNLQAFPYKEYTWNITVRNPSNQVVPGAVVGFYDPVSNEWVAKGVTNSLGYISVAMFETAVLGDVDLVVVKSGYETYVEQVLVDGSLSSKVVNIAKSKLVSAYVRNGTLPASNVVSYLINTDSSVPWIKRVLKSTGTAMAFDAYAGDFVLVIDAEGNLAHVQNLTVAGSDVPLTITLPAQTQRENSVTIDYGTDFTTFALTVATSWSYDEAYPGLRYSDMGNLRMQVDLLMGDGNGELTAFEAQTFYDALEAWGTEYVASDKLLKLNETAYVSDLAVTGFTMNLAAGYATDTVSVNYGYACGYQALSIPTEGGYYDALVYANYDTNEVNYTYAIDLAPGYERVYNSSGNYAVSGYTLVTVDPAKATGGPAVVAVKFEASEGPSAGAGIQFSSTAYIVRDDEGNITKYIVKVNGDVTFTAEDSADPNGNPLTYTWDFDDGNSATTTNDTYVYKYTTAALERTVNLTITDSVGMVNWTEITVVCDNADPVPVIQVKGKTINMTDFSITVNQTELITINGTDSYDYFVVGEDDLGMVDYVQFDYGDNTSSGRISSANNEQNVTHSYKTAGDFKLTLNVTDVVGHYKNLTLKVHVNDTTKPVIGYTVKNATGGATLVENATIFFNATDTKDNFDSLANLTFHWYFGDGEWDNETGPVTNHTYERFGKLTVSVKVQDSAGNNDTLARVITINSGPRPKMMVDRVYYSVDDQSFKPGNFTEDASGYILVNMTNKGSAVAKNIVVTFYKVNADGSQDEITGTVTILNATTLEPVSQVLVGGKVQVRFECSLGNPGTYSIKVVVTAENQSENTTFVASGTSSLTVEEAAWKEYVLWIGVLAVIILIPALIYVSRRLSKREKKGPRREKRSEEGQ